jgi:inner membrane protein
MDSLTQIVLGASVGEAVLGKKLGNRAMLWGAIAGTIPDLDVFIKFFTDEITSTELHRGVSHSLVFSVLMAVFLGWLVNKNEKLALGILVVSVFGMASIVSPFNFIQFLFPILILGLLWLIYKTKIKSTATSYEWGKLFFWSLVTHPLLDANTTWGTQFFWPFDYRLAFKNIFVVDPLYTIPFLIFVIIALCYKRTNPKRTRFNNVGLIVSSVYMLWSFVSKGIGYYQFHQELKQQEIKYVDLETKPTPFNTILWNAQVETETGFKMGYYSLFDTKPIGFSKEYTKNHYLLDQYKEVKAVQQLIKISTGMYLVEKVSEGLIFTDIRFGQMGLKENDQFPWMYLISEKDGIVSVDKIDPGFNRIKMGSVLTDLVDRIKGN